jgi:8-oxo-dGTP diphosphatase
MPEHASLTEEEFLRGYDQRSFPPISVTVDVVLLTVHEGRFSVLLVRRAGHPDRGKWALPGGFVEPDEDLDVAALRELGEETGLAELPQAMHLEQLRTYGAPGRDPRGRTVSIAHVAFLPDIPEPTAGSDADMARFWPVAELERGHGPALAFDHVRIVADGVERARAKIEYTPLAAVFLEEPFTLTDLRATYEEVWGIPQDPSNFRRKVLRLDGFVVPEGEIAPPRGAQGGRPAELYRRGPAKQLWPPLRRHETDDLEQETTP